MKLIFGDSHVGALIMGSEKYENQFKLNASHGQNLIDIELTETKDTLRLFSEKVADTPALDITLSKGDRVVFSGPLHSSIVSRHRFWKASAPWTMHESFPHHQLVSSNYVRTVAQDRTASMVHFLQVAKNMGINIAVIEPPRPSRRALTASGVDEVLMAHVDAAYRNAVRTLVKATGTFVISTPEATHDGTFMLPDYQAFSETDVHHGNKDYGILALANAAAFLDDETSGAEDAKTTTDTSQTDTPQTGKARKSILQKLLKS